MDLELAALEIPRRVAEEKEVEVAVPVIVEEDGVRGETGIIDVVLRRGLGEAAVAVVDEQQIAALLGRRPGWAGHREIDVDVPVVVDVDDAHTTYPAMRRDSCRLRDVLEPHVPFVQVQTARDHVAGKENVRQAV